MDFSIRIATKADYLEIMRIWLEGSQLAHPFLDEEELAYQKEEIETKYLGEVEMWVAETEEKQISKENHLDACIVANIKHSLKMIQENF